jgi:glycosyltransferase involved in cell wall biosynthesis
MKKTVGMIGYFARGKSKSGGQEAKTWSIAQELDNIYGKKDVVKVDTLNWKKHPLKLLTQLIWIGNNCKNVVMLPAQKSVRVFTPILLAVKRFSGTLIHYAVVGGWLPVMTEKHTNLRSWLKKVDYIYVETSSMKCALENQGFNNVVVFPNFKHIEPLLYRDLPTGYKEPFKLCFFARVTQKKGLEDAVRAVIRLNEKYKKTIYKLDIYGPVQGGEEQWFRDLKKMFSEDIEYKGFVEPNESVRILRNYFGLVFPTHFKTEGIPGTILDAYAAGVPVIASRWDNCRDLLDEGTTGYSFELGSEKALEEILEDIYERPDRFIAMKKNCIDKANRILPENIIKIMVDNMVQ